MLTIDKHSCCACGACAQICPKNAITMKPDENGFVYPIMDSDKCVDCNMCEIVCTSGNEIQSSLKTVYAAVSNDTDITKSASGGIFATLAQAVIKANGAVYGCAMIMDNGKLTPKHICVTDMAELDKLKGSKYVRSDIGNTYSDAKIRLDNGQTVLFSGTPCQIAGLKGYLQRDYDGLFTVDIVCHGVPSAEMFQSYIEYEEKRLGKRIVDFRFRDKTEGWKLYASMMFEDGMKKTFEPEESSYYQMFLNSYTYRENCYACPYASDKRPGDITIGDFWCIDLVHPELLYENGGEIDEARGVSCMIVNNVRGHRMLDIFGGGIDCWKSSYANASKYNRQLTAPSVLRPERDEVLCLYSQGYDKLDGWYRKRLKKIRFVRRLRAMIPKRLKRAVRSIFKLNSGN